MLRAILCVFYKSYFYNNFARQLKFECNRGRGGGEYKGLRKSTDNYSQQYKHFTKEGIFNRS